MTFPPGMQPGPTSDIIVGARKKIVIAIDGPAAAGKGTLARSMAERLRYAYLETGALYRVVALATLERGGDPASADDVMPALNDILHKLTPDTLSRPQLREARVADGASKAAALPAVRQALLDYQRHFAAHPPGRVGGAILDGRDIGTVVCPDADVKFFVTARVEDRAQRRFAEMKTPGVTYEDVLEEMKARDLRDSSRAVAPTKIARDAYVIDTTGMMPDDVLDEAIAVIRARFLRATLETP
jgi:cytidylate kinase